MAAAWGAEWGCRVGCNLAAVAGVPHQCIAALHCQTEVVGGRALLQPGTGWGAGWVYSSAAELQGRHVAGVHAGSCCRAGVATSNSPRPTLGQRADKQGRMLQLWAQGCGLALGDEVLPAGPAVLTRCLPRCHGHEPPAWPAGLGDSWASPCWSHLLPLQWGSRLAPSPQQVSFVHFWLADT